MRTTLIKGALKRACDAPGCNHEWRKCPVHDVRQERSELPYVVLDKGTSLGPSEPFANNSRVPTCRGCGYHVCSCARADPYPLSIAEWAERIRSETCDLRFVSYDELDRFPDTVEDSPLLRSGSKFYDGPLGEPYDAAEYERAKQRVADRLGRVPVTINGEHSGFAFARSEVRDSPVLRPIAIYSELVDKHCVPKRAADLLAQASTRSMYDAVMAAKDVTVAWSPSARFLAMAVDGKKLVEVEDLERGEKWRADVRDENGRLPEWAGSGFLSAKADRGGLDDVIRAKAAQCGVYKADPGELFGEPDGGAEGQRDGPIDYEKLSRDDRMCMLRAKLIARHDFSEKMADLVSQNHAKPMFSMLMKAQKVSAEISCENPFVVFVKGALPPGGKLDEFSYRLDFKGKP